MAQVLADEACYCVADNIGEPLDSDQVDYLAEKFKKLLDEKQGNK